jgi:type IV secretion system protein VirB5
MKKNRLNPCVVVLLGLCMATTAKADLFGVEDLALLANAVEQLKQLEAQYTLLKSTYDTAKSQLNGIKSLNEYNSGNYGFGGLENGLDALKQRQYSPNNWNDALKNIAGGNPTRYAELVRAYEANHPLLSDADFSKGASSARLNQYKQNTAVNKAVSVETTYAFNELNKHIKTIHTLSSEIDKAPNTKSAIDLNSRLVAELAYIQVMNVKLQTLISQQTAQNSADMLADEAESVRFNTVHKN